MAGAAKPVSNEGDRPSKATTRGRTRVTGAAKPVTSEGHRPSKATTRGRKRVAAEMLTCSSTYPTTESVSKRSATGQPDENDSERLTLSAFRLQLECKSSEAGVEEFL